MSTQQHPFVSLIIPTYKRDEPLLLTISGMLRQDYPRERYEIIVVDQTESHTEEVQRQMEAWEKEGLITWFRPPQISFAATTKARNWGVAHATDPEIIIFTDDDVEVEGGFIQAHVAAYTSGDIGAVAGKVIVPTHEYDPTAKTVGKITWMGDFVNNFHVDFPADVDNLIGCNFSLRASTVREAGLFDERFRGNAMREETDWAVRLREAGYRIRYVPETHLLHHMVAAGGSRAVSERIRWYEDLFFNNFLFYGKHAPSWRIPFFVMHMARPILACWLVYGKGRPSAFLAPWRGIRAGLSAAKLSQKEGTATVQNPRLRVF